MGSLYEIIGAIYSLGRIPRCKQSQLTHLKPGDRVLIAGAGHGTEAVAAARLGADVTAVDISATMLKQMEKKIDRANLSQPIRLVNDDILKFQDPDGYDMVIVNFFLNVFSEEKMREIFTHLTTLVKPGGVMVVGDFTLPAAGNWFFKIAQNIYWYIAAVFFWLTADNAVHPVYDYPGMLISSGFDIVKINYFSILGWKCYWSILARKSGA
jgi:demethylmenaquinone methyltransferase/2-methoxy-6-polyprenyl-1,4-benzoquinol methylase